ncbi:MAG: hypothetical protein WCF88_09750 [Candidatus Acidiferrales bacterium]|jgi:hypothetical protein
MRTFLNLALMLVLCSSSLLAQQGKSLSDSELAAITARGRMLAEYDVASRHATDAVVALKPAQGIVARYIARKIDGRWVVVFGKLNETKDAFLIAYEATQGSTPEEFGVKTYHPPQQDTGFFCAAAQGIQISLQSTHLENRPYNTYVLPLDSGQFYVYVLPAQTTADVYPLGGDTRYLLSADGSRISETRQLHRTILEAKHAAPSDNKTAAGYHTHVITDVPEDTDVFHVLMQSPPLPEYIGTKNGTYVVNTDGTIKRAK